MLINGVERTITSHADLRGANLCVADLCDADLCDADLRGANLCGANLCDASLWGANLFGADLRDANLHGADLSGANLCAASLWGADLSGANLRDANLSGANLCGANLWSCVGNRREVKSLQVERWDIAYTRDVIQIGCQRHSIANWRAWRERREWIDDMDPYAWEWAEKWLPVVLAVIDMSPAE